MNNHKLNNNQIEKIRLKDMVNWVNQYWIKIHRIIKNPNAAHTNLHLLLLQFYQL
jgi:hypothetical protein